MNEGPQNFSRQFHVCKIKTFNSQIAITD